VFRVDGVTTLRRRPAEFPWDVPRGSERRAWGMPTGTIARLLIDKGFGFIRDEGGIEHFFHRSSVRGAVFELLREGQRVEFTPEESAKGPRAGDVRLIEG
jgi:cold shock protein